MVGLNGSEAKERMVKHAVHNSTAMARPISVAEAGHRNIGAEQRRHDDEHLTRLPTLLLNERTLKVGKNNRQVVHGHMDRSTGLAKVDVMVLASLIKRGLRGNLSHHAAQHKSTLAVHIALIHGFEHLFLEGSPAFTSLFHVSDVELDVLISKVANRQATSISADMVGHELLVLLVRTHRTDFRSLHKLNDLIALGHRLEKFRTGDTGEPVFLENTGENKVVIADSGKRGRLNPCVSARALENRHSSSPTADNTARLS